MALRCETECCFFNTFGAAYFLSGFNAMMQLCFDKNYPERFHFGVKSWFVIKKCENNAKIQSLLMSFYRKCLTL